VDGLLYSASLAATSSSVTFNAFASADRMSVLPFAFACLDLLDENPLPTKTILMYI